MSGMKIYLRVAGSVGNSSPWVSNIVVEKNPKKNAGIASNNTTMEGDDSTDEDDKGWKVGDMKGKKPLVVRKPKKTTSAMPIPRSGGIIIRELAVESAHYSPMVAPTGKLQEQKDIKWKGLANVEEAKGKQAMEPLQVDEESDTNEAMNGGPLLEPKLTHKDPNEQHELVQDVEDDEDPIGNSVYKSMFSGGSVVQQLNAMEVKKDDMLSISDFGKWKNSDYDEDTASSSMKMSRNFIFVQRF